MKLLLQGAWGEVSQDFVKQLVAAPKAGEYADIEMLLESLPGVGADLIDKLGIAPDAVYGNVLAKADAYWALHALDVGVKQFSSFKESYRDELATVHAKQMRTFAEQYPTRILEPEVLRQVEYFRQAEWPDAVTINAEADRLGRYVDFMADHYFDGMTDVQISRIWHGQGILLAQENDIETCRVTGPQDGDTCSVCSIMIGLPIDVGWAADKLNESMDLEDPEEYVKAWPFPRVPDIDNMSREEVQETGLQLPPYHPHCRHGISWGSVEEAVVPEAA